MSVCTGAAARRQRHIHRVPSPITATTAAVAAVIAVAAVAVIPVTIALIVTIVIVVVAPHTASLTDSAGVERVVRGLVHTDEQHSIVCIEALLGAVAVMHIVVNDRNSLQFLWVCCKCIKSRNGHVVEHAEAHAPIALCMVTGRAYLHMCDAYLFIWSNSQYTHTYTHTHTHTHTHARTTQLIEMMVFKKAIQFGPKHAPS